MIVGGNEVYLLTLPWDMVSLPKGSMSIEYGGRKGEGKAGRQAAKQPGWRKPSTLARVTLSPKRSQQALQRQRGMCRLMLEPCPFTQKTWAIVPQRLKRTQVMDIASSGS